MNNFQWEYFIKLLTYNLGSPIIFTGLFFWGFFFIVFLIYSLIYRQINVRNIFLFAVSAFFYYKTSGPYLILLLFTICSDYFIGWYIHKSTKKIRRILLLTTSITINLFVLCYFKYAYFFTESFNEIFGTEIHVLNYFAAFKSAFTSGGSLMDRIILPVGISFYTFQTISYTTDIYRRKITPLKSILDFGFYVSFFPQLVAGPIVRASEFLPQIHKPYKLTGYMFGTAVFLILNGLIKKMVFGDYMAVQFIDRVYANPLIFTGIENLMAVLGYSLQVYLDFSGYTDIAIGIALLMGFRFNINFNSPYKAVNVEEFWKRWHISFSTWLRDYLYIPLGGNRHGTAASYLLISIMAVILVLIIGDYSWFWKLGLMAAGLIVAARFSAVVRNAVNTNINLMVTMHLGGLWHGSSWNFITWGGLNGIGLIFYKYWKKISPYGHLQVWYIRALRIAITFAFISFTRIWFRAQDKQTADAVLSMLGKIDWKLVPEVLGNFWLLCLMWSVAMVIHWLPLSVKRTYRHLFIRSHFSVKILAVLFTVFLIWQTLSADFVPFIYFQF